MGKSMPTTKEYKYFILEKLEMLDNIICKPMIGEYLLYYNGIYFGGICDNRLMVKIVQINKNTCLLSNCHMKAQSQCTLLTI